MEYGAIVKHSYQSMSPMAETEQRKTKTS